MDKTQMVDKSNFDNKQYKADLQCAYDCGYVKGQNDILEKLKAEIDLIKDSKRLIDDFDSGCERITDLLDKHISELKGENNTSEQVEKKCETCKYWNGGYVTFVCCECKNESEWIPELKGETE